MQGHYPTCRAPHFDLIANPHQAMQIAAGGEFATEFTTAQTNQQPRRQ